MATGRPNCQPRPATRSALSAPSEDAPGERFGAAEVTLANKTRRASDKQRFALPPPCRAKKQAKRRWNPPCARPVGLIEIDDGTRWLDLTCQRRSRLDTYSAAYAEVNTRHDAHAERAATRVDQNSQSSRMLAGEGRRCARPRQHQQDHEWRTEQLAGRHAPVAAGAEKQPLEPPQLLPRQHRLVTGRWPSCFRAGIAVGSGQRRPRASRLRTRRARHRRHGQARSPPAHSDGQRRPGAASVESGSRRASGSAGAYAPALGRHAPARTRSRSVTAATSAKYPRV